MNEYKNTYKEEINLAEILPFCLRRWRGVILTMLIFAMLAGGYKFYSARKSNLATLKQWDEMGMEKEASVNDSDVLKAYQSLVEQCAQAVRTQGEYLDSSLIMQLDTNHLQTGTLSYVVRKENAQYETDTINSLVSAYKAYVTDGRLAQLLYSEDDAALADAQYLLMFSDNAAGLALDTEEMSVDIGQRTFFQIQIISTDADSCEENLKTVSQSLRSYSEELQNQLGNHELTLLGTSIVESQNQVIQDYQTKIINNYVVAVRNLNTLRTEAETYADTVGAGSDGTSDLTTSVLASPVRAGIKFAILGLVLGIFLSGVTLIILFIMNDKLHGTDNFESKYDMRLLGRVIEPIRSKGIFGILDRFFVRMGEGAYSNLPYEEQIRIVSANIKTAIPQQAERVSVMLAGTMAARDVEAFCEAITKEISGVTFSGYRQLIFDASALEELDSFDVILFIEKKDVSSSRLIWQEGKMAKDRKADILGAVVI